MLHYIVLWLLASHPSHRLYCFCAGIHQSRIKACYAQYHIDLFQEITGIGIFQSMSQLEDSGYQKQANMGSGTARKQTDFVRESGKPLISSDLPLTEGQDFQALRQQKVLRDLEEDEEIAP